jgi:hypothetical protein
MKTKVILSTTIAIFALASCLLAEEVKYPPINPALTYWQAAAEMPELRGEKADLLRDLVSGRKPFDALKAKELLAGSERSMKLFASASASPAPCDWGLPLEEGPEMGLPHVSKINELSRFAILKADVLFAEGKTSEGIEWLLKVHRAARHAGAGDILITALVQFSIEISAVRAAAWHCLEWDESMRNNYADGLKALPALHEMQDALRGEIALNDSYTRHFESIDTNTLQRLLEALSSANQSNNKSESEIEAEAKLLREQLTSENFPKLIAETRELYLHAQTALGKPWKESEIEVQAITKQAQQSTIFVKLTFPSFEQLNLKRFEVKTLRTMLDAALQYGPKLDEAAAASFKDAFDGEPLVLKKGDDGGLTLTTGRQYRKGKDIELKLGR